MACKSGKGVLHCISCYLDSNYQNYHAAEALGLYKALPKSTTFAAIYLRDYTLALEAKFSTSLQTKQLDLFMISSLVDAIIHALDDAITPVAYWILETLDSKDDVQEATGEIVSADKIHIFQDTVGTPFVALLKENMSSRFATHDIVPALAIFDPRNIPSTDSSQFPTFGKNSIAVLLSHLGKGKFALTLNDDETLKQLSYPPEEHTEWITFRTLQAKKPEDSIALQLNELITKEMLVTMFPNFQKIAAIGLTLPVSTTSVERISPIWNQSKHAYKISYKKQAHPGNEYCHWVPRSTYRWWNRSHHGYLEQETSKNIYLNPVNNYRNNYSSLCCNSKCVGGHVTLCNI